MSLPTIVGHAAVFQPARSVDLGGFVEQIAPHAFDRTIRTADVRALLNHDPSLLLGRSSSGTLALDVDREGLAVAIEPPDTELGRSTVELLRRGDLDQMSWSFTVPPNGDEWELLPNGTALRTLLDVDLLDVTVATWGAYPSTDVGLSGPRDRRALDRHRRLRLALAETTTADPMRRRLDRALRTLPPRDRAGVEAGQAPGPASLMGMRLRLAGVTVAHHAPQDLTSMRLRLRLAEV